ncbi:hypothetical protein Tco_0339286 [Tanacetum coccineum]
MTSRLVQFQQKPVVYSLYRAGLRANISALTRLWIVGGSKCMTYIVGEHWGGQGRVQGACCHRVAMSVRGLEASHLHMLTNDVITWKPCVGWVPWAGLSGHADGGLVLVASVQG